MKFIWPPVIKALEDRQAKIAEGLASGERGERALELAEHKVIEQLRDAKLQAAEIIEKANHRGSQLIDEAKVKAREEGLRLLELAREEVQQEVNSAKQALRQQVAGIAIAGAEKILNRNIDEAANRDILDNLIKEI